MRKCIFKREIDSELQRSGLDHNGGIAHEILNILFDNPYNTTSQYLLKKQFGDLNAISVALGSVSISNLDQESKIKFIGNVRSIFEMDDDLDLPQKLREQIAGKEKLAIFVGSGVSKLIGFPLWPDLATKAINYLYEEKIISHSEKERLLAESSSPKHKLSVFHKLLEKKDNRSSLFYGNVFDSRNTAPNPYDLLARLECVKVSINYDCEFWNALDFIQRSQVQDSKDSTAYNKPDLIDQGVFEITQAKSNAIYQIHGSYKKIDKYSIITLSDYLDKYYLNPQSGPSAFLRNLFREYVTIFIGCGLEEFEIIQHLIEPKEKQPKHHLLVGTYLGDTNLLRMKREYFRDSLGINVHGYYLDNSGYYRLYTVLESWAKHIPSEQGGILKRIDEANGIEL